MARIKVLGKTFETSYEESLIREAVNCVAQQINADYADKDPLFVCVLNGSFMFAADLMKKVSVLSQISFVKVASYAGTHSSGVCKDLIGLNEDLTGRNVVIVEDIVDTGYTIDTLMKQIKAKGAADIQVCTMVFKPDSFQYEEKPRYIGLSVPNAFILGYGLDFDGYGRNLPEIYTLIEE